MPAQTIQFTRNTPRIHFPEEIDVAAGSGLMGMPVLVTDSGFPADEK
jgi:hypothetical protein